MLSTPAGRLVPGLECVQQFVEMAARDDKMRFDARGRDLDEAVEILSAGYNGRGFQVAPTEAPFSFRHTIVGDGAMTLRSTMFMGRVDGQASAGDEHVVHWLLAGRSTVDNGRDEVAGAVGRPVLFPQGREFEFTTEDVNQSLLHLSKAVVDEVAAERHGIMPGTIRFDHAAPVSSVAVQAWHATVRLIGRAYLGSGEPSDLMRTEMARLAAGAMLDTFAHTSTRMPDALLAPRNASLRLAVEYMHAAAHLPITAADIAQEAGLTPRGLQQAFSRHLDTTPTAYLREIRLERVHEALRAATPDSTTVADVARHWAFAHLGRFSAAYQQRFGEYPRETLHRG
jgi:AraC-like DNA-binding protein